MEIRILLLMILCHVIDDFVLQPASLSKLKQKKFWENYNELYKHDYKIALLIHSISWSITILLPVIFLTQAEQITLLIAFFINATIHYVVDDLKANMGKINLITDQTIHFTQVVVTWVAIIL